MLILAAISLFMLLALITYHPGDPGFSGSADAERIRNAGGVVGAWFSDLMFLLFGYVAYLFPVGVAWGAWRAYRVRQSDLTIDRWAIGTRSAGMGISLLFGTALLSLHMADPEWLPLSAGGVLGTQLASVLASILNFEGATLMALALLLAGITLGTGLSWLNLTEQVGGWTLSAWAWLRDRGEQVVARVRERLDAIRHRRDRGTAREREAEREETRRGPRIEPAVAALPEGERAARERQIDLLPADLEEGLPGGDEPPIHYGLDAGPADSGPPFDSNGDVQPAASGARSAAGEGRPRKRAAPAAATRTATPPSSLLDDPPRGSTGYSRDALEAMSRQLEHKLRDFGVEVEVESVQPGPVITRFEVLPGSGVKVSQIVNLAKDLARALSVVSVRVVEIIPGKQTVGLEVPNEQRATIALSEIIRSQEYERTKAPLTVGLGKDIGGHPVVADLAKTPHLLVAGTTGSGKSVGVNAMILSLLYRNTPEQVRLIMVDPKMLELSVYDGIPHLLAPVVTDMNDAANALRWCVAEMERRYRLMAALGVRNIDGFNTRIRKAREAGEPVRDPLFDPAHPDHAVLDDETPTAPELETLPLIVVVVDELADMMMIVGKKVEELIARLAQKARAAGIHLILATQRPSVDVITGLIKANIPTRMAFQVSSKVDSRTILDQIGAEALLGQGDMLYLPPGSGLCQRVHGAFVSDAEVHRVVEYLKETGEPDYVDEILQEGAGGGAATLPGEAANQSEGEGDPLYDDAVRVVTETRRASISGVQRRLKIGYNRAARLVEEMESAGVVGPLQSNGAREVLAPPPPEA